MPKKIARPRVPPSFVEQVAPVIADACSRAVDAESRRLTGEIKAIGNLSGGYTDPLDAVRQIRQAALSNEANCKTLEEQVAAREAEIKNLQGQVRRWEDKEVRRASCCDDNEQRAIKAEAIAHDLLTALKEYHNANRVHHDEDWRLYQISEAAIDKAEGRTGEENESENHDQAD